MINRFTFERKFENLLAYYEKQVNHTLKLPKRILIILLGMIFLTFGLIPFIGISYFPTTDSGFFIVNIKAPTGTRVEVTAKDVQKVENIIRRMADNDVDMIISNSGITPDFTALYTSNSASHTAFIQVNLSPHRKESTAHLISRISPVLHQELPHLKAYFQSGGLVEATLSQGAPAPIDIQISSFDLKAAHKIAALIAAKVNTLSSVRDVFIPQDMDAPSLMLDINREYASELGVSPQEIINTVITSLTSNQMIAPNYWIDPQSGNDYFLTVQYPEGTVKTLQDLKSIPIRSAAGKNTVYLDAVARIKSFVSPTVITHYQLQRVIDIYVSPRGEDLGPVSAQINRVLKEIEIPHNISVQVRGLVESMHSSFKSFGMGLCLSVLLVYLVLVAQFKSFIDPFIILLAILPGLSGVIFTLFLTGTTLNIISLMGTLMMIGITVSNSILIVEFTHRSLKEGFPLKEAVIHACRVRLRPILMTSCATIVALFPMSLGLSEGSETYAPLARVIIGGLSVSVIVTIFLIPATCLAIYQRRAHVILSCIILMIGNVSYGAPCTHSLTLQQAQEIALAQHPDILAAQHSVEASRQEVDSALSTYYPQVGGSAVGACTGKNTRVTALGDPSNPLTNPLILKRGSVGLGVNQMLTDFGRTPSIVSAADSKVDARLAKSLSVRDRVRFDVTRAYYNTLLAEQIVKVATETLKVRLTLLEKIQLLAHEKLKAAFDVDIATQSVDDAKLLVLKAQNDLENARAELSQALGYGELMHFDLSHHITLIPPNETLHLAEETAKKQNPDLVSLRSELTEKKFKYEAAVAEHYPTVNAIGYAGQNPLRKKSELESSYAVVGVALDVPLYTGGRLTADARQKLSEMKTLEMDLRAKENRILRDVRIAWNSVQSSYQNIGVTKELFLNNVKALELAQASYDVGLISIVDLVQEQLNKTKAEISSLAAGYEYLVSYAFLNLLLGETKKN